MNFQFTPEIIHASVFAGRNDTAQKLANECARELQNIPMGPASIACLAMCLFHGKTVKEAMQALRDRLADARTFVGTFGDAYRAEEENCSEVLNAAKARIAAISKEIGQLHRECQDDDNKLSRANEQWDKLKAVGLSREQILATGATEPASSTGISGLNVARHELYSRLEEAVSVLKAEQLNLYAFIYRFDPRALPDSLRGEWVSPLGNGELLEGL